MEQDPKVSTQGAKHVWTLAKDSLLVECLVTLRVEQKFMADSGFRPGFLQALEDMMELKAPGCGIKGIPHIQSRLKTLKGSWQTVHDMVYGANTSGFGWDPIRNCVTADDQVWDEYVKVRKKAAAFRNKSFPLFEQLTFVWGKERATGVVSQAAEDIVDEIEHGVGEVGLDDVDYTGLAPDIETEVAFSEEPTSNVQEVSSTSRKRQRNSRKKEALVEVIREAVTAMDKTLVSVSEGLGTRVDKLAREATMDTKAEEMYMELLKVEGLTEDELNDAHIKIMASDRLMVSFPRIPNGAKASWVRRLIK